MVKGYFVLAVLSCRCGNVPNIIEHGFNGLDGFTRIWLTLFADLKRK